MYVTGPADSVPVTKGCPHFWDSFVHISILIKEVPAILGVVLYPRDTIDTMDPNNNIDLPISGTLGGYLFKSFLCFMKW